MKKGVEFPVFLSFLLCFGGLAGLKAQTCTGKGTKLVHVEDCSASFEPKEAFLRIFPNPAQGFFQVETADTPVWITLFNSAGQAQTEKALQASSITEISTSGLPSGIYILRWKTALKSGALFLVIENGSE